MSLCSCPTCGATVPSGRFCAACGTGLPTAAVPAQPTAADVDDRRHVSAPVAHGVAQHHWVDATPPPLHEPTVASPFDILPVTDVLPSASPAFEPPPYVPGGHTVPYGQSPASPRDSRSTGAVALTVAALAVGGWFLVGKGADHTVTGSLSLVDSAYDSYSVDQSCTGFAGYDDIGAGTEVVLEDGNGRTLATSALGRGSYDGVSCVFAFTLPDVPRADVYVLSLGNAVRGDERYSYDDMVERDWSTELVLGDD